MRAARSAGLAWSSDRDRMQPAQCWLQHSSRRSTAVVGTLDNGKDAYDQIAELDTDSARRGRKRPPTHPRWAILYPARTNRLEGPLRPLPFPSSRSRVD